MTMMFIGTKLNSLLFRWTPMAPTIIGTIA